MNLEKRMKKNRKEIIDTVMNTELTIDEALEHYYGE